MKKEYDVKELCFCGMCDYCDSCPLRESRFMQMRSEWAHLPIELCNMAKTGLIVRKLNGYDAFFMAMRESTTLETTLEFVKNFGLNNNGENFTDDFIKLFIMMYQYEPRLYELLEFVFRDYPEYEAKYFDKYHRIRLEMIQEF